ncbi:MAG: P1 family peptidase [Gemmatimonadales bacterium]
MCASITDVRGLTVGHQTDNQATTGLTVVLGPSGGVRAAAHLRGRATGTRELDALSPRHLVGKIHGILLTGGSAFGLGAADGVMRWLDERGRGYDVGVGVVPIVPTAVIFDLGIGDSHAWPRADDGYQACETATAEVEEGSVGVGTGATVGKVRGLGSAMKGGVGTWSASHGDTVVGCLAVVNAFGDVRDRRGEIIAGTRTADGFLDARRYLAHGGTPGGSFAREGGNTTLVVVATNADLDRVELAGVAVMATDALGQRITPVGTQYDGDIVFALSTGEVTPRSTLPLELLAQEVTGVAVERAVRLAHGTKDVPGLGEYHSSP